MDDDGALPPYTVWRQDKEPNRVGDPPRLRYTVARPRTPFYAAPGKGKPWCEACDAGFYEECYCAECKGCDPTVRGRFAGCYCWLNRQLAGDAQ